MIKRWAARAAVAALGASGLLSACGGSSDATVPPPAADGGGDGDGGGATPDDGAAPRACVPGQQVACACPGDGPRSRGAQVCNAEGTGYGPCIGCDAPDATVPDAAVPDANGDDGSTRADAADAGDADDAASSPDGGPDASEDAGDAALPDAGRDGGVCTTVPAARAPVFMLFALDGSGSMSDANKWTAATGAVDAIFADMKAQGDPGLGAGLNVFSDAKDPTCGAQPLGLGGCTGPYPSSADVPIAFVDATQYGKLTDRTSSSSPSGDTPTGAVLTGGYSELEGFVPTGPLPPNGKKVLVLITDGVPTDECAPAAGDGGVVDYAQNTCVQRAAQALATVGPAGSVETFVVGVGSLPGDFQSYDPYFLGALAQAGGTAPAGCDPKSNAAAATNRCYFNIDPAGATSTQQALEDALDAIRGQVATCDVPINLGAAGPLDPGNFNVELGGAIVPQGTNGWTFDNLLTPKDVILHGAACATITSAPTTAIDFVVGCPTVTQ